MSRGWLGPRHGWALVSISGIAIGVSPVSPAGAPCRHPFPLTLWAILGIDSIVQEMPFGLVSTWALPLLRRMPPVLPMEAYGSTYVLCKHGLLTLYTVASAYLPFPPSSYTTGVTFSWHAPSPCTCVFTHVDLHALYTFSLPCVQKPLLFQWSFTFSIDFS